TVRHGVRGSTIRLPVMPPSPRRDLVDSAVIVECMFAGRLENLTPPHNPLDVLAQQTVAAAAMEALQVDEWSRTRAGRIWLSQSEAGKP
ncbi:hypothetical protein ACUOA8_55960, partial [Escherichia sp. SS-MK2]